MNEWVLDASAALAVLKEEPGSEVVEQALPACIMSTVNLSEVLSKLGEFGIAGDAAWNAVAGLALTFVEFDTAAAREAASLRPATRRLGLSLGDRACLALGRTRGAPVLTADRVWTSLDLGVEVTSIR